MGRATAKEKCRDLQQQLQEARDEAAWYEAESGRRQEEVQRLQQRLGELTAELARPRPVTLPLGEAPPGMQYGVGLIELCVNLARELGLRRAVRALQILFRWLGVEVAIPAYQTICTWMQRVGMFRQEDAEHADGGTWIVNHTNQIGKEKVLAVLPGESWKREDVLEVYAALAEEYGVPRAIASDGAPELQEPIALLGERLADKPPKTAGTRPQQPLALRDPKHFLANQLEALLTRDLAWQEFSKHVGATRSAVQQTELAHFTPPAFKTKARFMNLASTLHWANTLLWHWDHPDSQSRRGITPQRIEEKLGWLQPFAPNFRAWQACQEVVNTALTFLNARGLFRGATKQLQKLVAKCEQHPLCRKLIAALLKFVQGYEDQLKPREQLSMSTEILESCFAKYKQLEQQHSKGGFTSLLLTFPVLLRPTTAAEITASMHSTKVADINAWKQDHLPSTLTSRRQLLYREARPNTKRRPKNRATHLSSTDYSFLSDQGGGEGWRGEGPAGTHSRRKLGVQSKDAPNRLSQDHRPVFLLLLAPEGVLEILVSAADAEDGPGAAVLFELCLCGVAPRGTDAGSGR